MFKFQAITEKMANNFERQFFAAPCSLDTNLYHNFVAYLHSGGWPVVDIDSLLTIIFVVIEVVCSVLECRLVITEVEFPAKSDATDICDIMCRNYVCSYFCRVTWVGFLLLLTQWAWLFCGLADRRTCNLRTKPGDQVYSLPVGWC